jgi:hypothetical protein
MLAIDPSNLMLRTTLEQALTSTESTTTVNLSITEFDYLTIKLAAYDDDDTLICLIGGPSAAAVLDAGGLHALGRYFHEFQMIPQPLPEYDLGIIITRSAVQADASRVAEVFSRIRTILVAGIYLQPLESMLAGASQQPREVAYRSNERVWVLPTEDRVTFILEVCFDNAQDRSMAKIFMVEFEESKRHITNAPLIQFFPRAPQSLSSFGVGESANSHYLSLTFLKSAFKADSAKKVETIATWLSEFKRYLTYHIHGLKGYLHSRMRKKTAGFLKVLEAAVPENLESKTFKRVRGTRTFREDSQIVNDVLLPEARSSVKKPSVAR